MREEKKFLGREVLHALMFVLVVFIAVFTLDIFSAVSYAESQGKAKANVKVREKPTTKSEVVDGFAKNDAVTVTGIIKGLDSDGKDWYQVLTKDQKTGYIRSDLLTITSGTPQELNADGTPVNTQTENPPEAAGVYVAVKPVSTTVTGSVQARVRAEASSSATLLKTAETGLTVTVVGYEYDGDGTLWYKVKYSTNNEEVTGFISSNYIAVSKEELQPAENTGTDPDPQTNPQPSDPTPAEKKDYDTMLNSEGNWILVDNTQSPAVGWPIKEMLNAVETNKEKLQEVQASSKKKSTAITLCVIIIIALIAVIAIGFIKVRDMVDEADMLAAEKANPRRSADRPQTNRNPGMKQGQNPGQKNPAAGRTPANGKPVPPQSAQAKNPNAPKADKKPQGNPQMPQAKMPSAQGNSSEKDKQQTQKPRNIMDNEDDFEFEFLNKKNWDESEKK